MSRPQRSVLKAYVYWLFLGVLGGHRFYIGKPGTAVLMAFFTLGGFGLFALGIVRDMEALMISGTGAVALTGAAMIVDIFLIPGLVEDANNPDRGDRSFIQPSGSMDPSFSATMRSAGIEKAEDERRSSLPEDYVMPWRRDQGEAKKYRPDED